MYKRQIVNLAFNGFNNIKLADVLITIKSVCAQLPIYIGFIGLMVLVGVVFTWSMITLASTALGIEEGSTVLEGVSGIKWSKKRKIEPNYGLGGNLSAGVSETSPTRRASQIGRAHV